jgi:hypothetical protein
MLFFHGKKNLLQRLFFYKIITISTYFWSGISKVNNYFISEVLPAIQAFIGLSFENEIVYLIPFLEILIAILFIFNKTKKYGACLAVINHAFIILWLSFSSINNIVVIPWNLFLIYAIINLFYLNSEHAIIEFKSLKKKSTLGYKSLGIVLFLLPLLSYFGMLDKHLGFHLYSGNKEYAIIAIEENSALKLTKNYQKYQKKIENTEGGYLIDLNKWSYNELKVPIPPEQRIFKAISQKFCAKEIPKDHVVILIYKGNFEENNFWSFNCSMDNWIY